MQIILENRITSVTADSENSSYPDDNVLDDSPKKVWKANGSESASLTCLTIGAVDTIAIFNTNAQSVVVNITDPNEFEWQNLDWQNLIWQETSIDVTADIETQANSNAIWGTFSGVSENAVFTVSLSAATGINVEAGIVVIGTATEITDPQYGLTEGLQDYSIEEELSNGARYYKQRDIVRTFGGSMLMDRDTEFYTFMHSFAREYGKSPKAIRVTDLNSYKWAVYAQLASMPSGIHQYPTHTPVNFEFIEVL